MDELYSEIILDHYRHPHNSGTLPCPDIRVTEYNPLCGDAITLDIALGKTKTVRKVKFSGQGCAISQASASLLTDAIKGLSLKKIQALSGDDILALLHIPLTPVRMKCALLALFAAHKAAVQGAEIKQSLCKKKK
jgi:nitrogen fixation NifU-like protein